MCSIVGYVGRHYGKDKVLEGLARLEYRGYDSAGIACLDPQRDAICYHKAAGTLDNLLAKVSAAPFDGYLSSGHTRWATHGMVTEDNAHPHFNCTKTISVMHNGTIENHHALRHELEQHNHVFHSQTDTETIAHLLEQLLAQQEQIHPIKTPPATPHHPTPEHLKNVTVRLVEQLQGAYAFIALLRAYPDTMLVVRKSCPLCIGIGDGEKFIASDPVAFAGMTDRVIFMPDETFALVTPDRVDLYNFNGEQLFLTAQQCSIVWQSQQKQGFAHYMLKEMYEQKNAIRATIDDLQAIDIWQQLGISVDYVRTLKRIHLIGCGTSWHAARIAQFYFEEMCHIPTSVHLASEFRYMNFFPDEQALYIGISQSGETADTLEALRLVRGHKGSIPSISLPTIALTNVPSSTIVRECDGFLLTKAGPEIAVGSTKAFSTQLAALYWLAHCIAHERQQTSLPSMGAARQSWQETLATVRHDLMVAAEILEDSIERYKTDIIQRLAPRYAQFAHCIVLGRHTSYPCALEAGLKLKEIAYLFAQCYPAGELKHGPLALLDDQTPVFLFSDLHQTIYQKIVLNAQEIKARNGHLVVFAFAGQDELIALADQAFVVPQLPPLLGPLAVTGLMQFFVYQIAVERGCPIDKPRNLAKSVTVE